jgi:UDP-2,3-diacylglucosamine pyrophosphatase LpxH
MRRYGNDIKIGYAALQRYNLGVSMPSSSASGSPHLRLRALFLSDLHLGNAGSRADLILAFLQTHRAETYYLVGDILDLSLPFGSIWGNAQQAVIDHLQARQQDGAKVVFVLGNHDPEAALVPEDLKLGHTPVQHAVHIAADGLRYLVVHGDSADFGPFRKKWLERIGMAADQVMRRLDQGMSVLARWMGMTFVGVMPGLMRALNMRLYHGGNHETHLVQLSQAAGLDGVICGHFHLPALHLRQGQVYANCGDWLDNFGALGEDFFGRLSLLHAMPPVTQAMRPPHGLGQRPVGA